MKHRKKAIIVVPPKKRNGISISMKKKTAVIYTKPMKLR